MQAALGALLRPSTVNAKNATTDTPSTLPQVVSATANADAVNGSFQVTVSQLATATRVMSGSALGNAISRTATLGTAGFRITPITDNSGQPTTSASNGKTISVDNATTLADGTVQGGYAQIAIANFANPAGLNRAGGNLFTPSTNSDAASYIQWSHDERPRRAQGRLLEMSNVDLAAQFTNMIIAQRGFQANSRVITASDEVLQDLVNIKH